MFEAIDIIFPLILYVSQGLCLQYFYGSFLEGRWKDRRWNGLAAASSYIAVRMALWKLDPSGILDYRTAVWKLAESLLLLAALAVCFYRAFRLITVFLAVAFQAVADISRYAAVILFGELGDRVFQMWNWCMGNGFFKSEKAFGIAVNSWLVFGWVLEFLTIILLMFLPLKKITGDFREKDYGIQRTELLFILTPAAVGLMLCVLLRVIIVTVEDGIPKILYDRYPVLAVLIPAILLLSLLSILQGVKLFQDMVYWNRERSGRIILEKQVESMQEHIEEMERVYSGIRSMKHDMKNTMCVIRRLLEGSGEKGNEELKAYLEEMNRTFEKLEVRFRTGNTIVDTLLNMKYHEAVREMPDLRMEADRLLFPQSLNIRSYDIGIILGNALDNAIEACRKLKGKEEEADAFIRLCSLERGNLLIVKVENSFDGQIAQKGKDGFPATGKADKDSHGLGLSNMKSTVEKYHGTMDFKIKGKVFILSMMMKNERRNDNGV